MERASSVKSSKSNISQNSRLLTHSQLESSLSLSETPSTSTIDTYSLKMRVSSSTSGSCSGASKSSNCKTSMIHNSLKKNVRFTERTPVVILDDSQDPFAFDEYDIAPSKWDILSGKQKKSRSKKYVANREFEDGCQSQTNAGQQELNDWDVNCSGSQQELNDGNVNFSGSQQELNDGDINCSGSNVGDAECSCLLTDCLLTAVKVFSWMYCSFYMLFVSNSSDNVWVIE